MKHYSTDINDLLQDGYTSKFAKYYLDQAKSYSEMKIFDEERSNWALSKGFLADSACWYNLNDNNAHSFLSDYDYYRLWPLNDWQRIWINDKLTLKYMLDDTEYSNIMPEYYFYTAQNKLLPLINVRKSSIDNLSLFINLLEEKKVFACKPCNGTSSLGFFKLSFADNKYYINDKLSTKEQIMQFVHTHPNYVFTEYLNPGGYLSKLSDKIHTLRLVTINPTGCNPIIIGGYLRIPSMYAEAANYCHFEDKDLLNGYNIVTNINVETGDFYDARFVYTHKSEKVLNLGDNNLFGTIEEYAKLREMVLGIANRFNAVEYMGFDLCITNHGFKCMEINSHPGIRHMQLFQSLYKNIDAENYFKKRIDSLNALSPAEKIARNGIIR